MLSDTGRSYCSSINDDHPAYLQPYDFGTSRKTKRFFREDYINLTKAAIDKEYALKCYKKEMEKDVPHLLHSLMASSRAFRAYFDKVIEQKANGKPVNDPLRLVRPESPSWKRL